MVVVFPLSNERRLYLLDFELFMDLFLEETEALNLPSSYVFHLYTLPVISFSQIATPCKT